MEFLMVRFGMLQVDASTRVQLVEQIRQALDSSLANGS
jgi:hypothetical protein